AQQDGVVAQRLQLLGPMPTALMGQISDSRAKADHERVDVAVMHAEATFGERLHVEICSSFEGLVEHRGRRDALQSKTPEVLRLVTERNEIGAATVHPQQVRLDDAVGYGLVGRTIGEE